MARYVSQHLGRIHVARNGKLFVFTDGVCEVETEADEKILDEEIALIKKTGNNPRMEKIPDVQIAKSEGLDTLIAQAKVGVVKGPRGSANS